MSERGDPRQYDLVEHRHRLAVWSAARAASRGGDFGVKVEDAFRWIGGIGIRGLLSGYDHLPAPNDFDERHREWRRGLICRAGEGLSHGKAAKLINVYLKVGVVCASCSPDGRVPDDARARIGAIHPPLDRILRDTIQRCTKTALYPRSAAWSRLGSCDYQAAIDKLKTIARQAPVIKESSGVMELWRVERFWSGFVDGQPVGPDV